MQERKKWLGFAGWTGLFAALSIGMTGCDGNKANGGTALEGGKFWRDVQSIDKEEANGSKQNTKPQIVMDASGRALVVWMHDPSPNAGGLDRIIRYNRYDDGWQGATDIGDPGSTLHPRLSGNEDGYAMALIVYGNQTYARRFSPEAGWDGNMSKLNTGIYTGPWGDVAIGTDGDAWAVWRERIDWGTHTYRVSVRHYDAQSGSWDAPVSIYEEENRTSEIADFDIDINQNGRVALVWNDGKNVSGTFVDGVYKAAFENAPGPQSVQTVDEYQGEEESENALSHVKAFSGNEEKELYLWTFDISSNIGVSFAKYDASGGSTGLLSPIGEGGGYLALEHGPEDVPVAAWPRVDENGSRRIWVARYDWSDYQWKDKTAVSDVRAGWSPGLVDLAVNERGDIFVVWQEADGNMNFEIWGNHFDPIAGAWEGAIRIDEGLGSNGRFPAVAVDPEGNAIVVWDEKTPNGYKVYSRSYR
jgi:hypothetical protein